MLLGDRVVKIEAEIKEIKPHRGLKINIAIRDVKRNGKRLSIDYLYSVNYGEDIGYINIHGRMFAEEEEKEAKKLEEAWKKDGKLPKQYMEKLLNAINYTCSSHATIVARVLNYLPPLIPPKLAVKEEKKKAK